MDMEIKDEKSGNTFELTQACGLPQGERALIFQSDKDGNDFIRPKQLLCNYSKELIEYTNEKKWQSHKFHAYAVRVNQNLVVLPQHITPDQNNLGLFCNCSLIIDPLRRKTNAKLKVTNARKDGSFPLRIRIHSTKKIEKGDEIIISYGKEYNEVLKEKILISRV